MNDKHVTESDEEELQPYFGSFILETLTLGMYGESRNAIREYVQNAFDSLQAAVEDKLITAKKGRIDITVNGSDFIVRDNGAGIPKKLAVDMLTSIGASRKDYTQRAGFRGIGRLAGLVLCDSLVFTTKAANERLQTVVTFDAKRMRYDMSPARASTKDLSRLLTDNIRVKYEKAVDPAAHFFEVALLTLHEAPPECTDVDQLSDYLSQVAPVPYAPDFTYADTIRLKAKQNKVSLDEVHIFIGTGAAHEAGFQVFKPYSDTLLVGRVDIQLNETEFVSSPSGLWWGWVGKKVEPGAYKSETVKALRVRVRNIQIDGAQLMSKLFSEVEDAPSYGRFNDWYVGEIFADGESLVPNARRDGFEYTEEWLAAKAELIALCGKLGLEAYVISKEHQHSIKQLSKATRELEGVVEGLEVSKTNTVKVIQLAQDIIKVQRKTARAAKDSDYGTSTQFATLEARLLTLHKKTLSRLATGEAVPSTDALVAAKRNMLKKLIAGFRTSLDSRCLEKAMDVIRSEFGDIDLDEPKRR